MKSELCPVCRGSGKYIFLQTSTPLKISIGGNKKQDEPKTCHGCDGKGWIEVHEEKHYHISDNMTRQKNKKNNDWYCYTCNKWHSEGQICSR